MAVKDDFDTNLGAIGANALVRPQQLHAYSQFLRQRDGVLDFAQKRLSGREPTMNRFESAKQKGSLDKTLFQQQYERFDHARSTSPEMLLLLALVKMNGTEAYGVEYTFETNLKRAPALRDAMEERLVGIMIDEIGHVTFNRLGLGEWGSSLARSRARFVVSRTSEWFSPDHVEQSCRAAPFCSRPGTASPALARCR